MSDEEYNQGKQIGIIIAKLDAMEHQITELRGEVQELKNSRAKFLNVMFWISGLSISGGALGGKLAHLAGLFDGPK